MAVFKEINTFTYPKMKKKLKMKKLFLSRSPQKVKEIKTTNFGSNFYCLNSQINKFKSLIYSKHRCQDVFYYFYKHFLQP